MQLLNIVQAALLTTYIHAAPVSESPTLVSDSEAPALNESSVLLKRADFAAVRCGPPENQKDWGVNAVTNSFYGLDLYGKKPVPERPAAGNRRYPMQLGQGSRPPRDPSVQDALNDIPECSTTLAGGWKWFEFPLLDPVFAPGAAAGEQGPDRVVAISRNIGPGGERQFTYCLAVTHRGVPGGGFVPCQGVVGDA